MFSTHLRTFLILFLLVMYALHAPLVIRASDDAVQVMRVQSQDVSSDDTPEDNRGDQRMERLEATAKYTGDARPLDTWTQVKQQGLKIRDARKQEIFNRIIERLHTINKNATDRMTNALTGITTILEKLTAEAATLKNEGTDTSTVDPLLEQAQDALTLANAAVESQAEKEYTLDVGDDSELRQTLGSLVSQMRQDLRDTWKTVIDAKQSVRAVSTELNRLTKTDI